MKRFLHVGCGPIHQDQLVGFDNPKEWQETRLDIDESVKPDIVGTLTDLGMVKSESMDAVFSSHNIEHIFPHEVPVALAEFKRVLKPDGFAVVTCPDLQLVARSVVNDRLDEQLYMSQAGPITPLDILYGHGDSIAAGNVFMAHKGGFTRKTLAQALKKAGFPMMFGNQMGQGYQIWMIALRKNASQGFCTELAGKYFPPFNQVI